MQMIEISFGIIIHEEYHSQVCTVAPANPNSFFLFIIMDVSYFKSREKYSMPYRDKTTIHSIFQQHFPAASTFLNVKIL